MIAVAAGFAVLVTVCAHAAARAETEFCPARIAAVSAVPGNASIAVNLSALGPRSVTGQFLIETDRGWFRAPFPPVALVTQQNRVESRTLEITLPKKTSLENIWLSQAASDDPQWGPRGMVTCPPEPERRTATNGSRDLRAAERVAALPIAPPFAYDCKTPFAAAHVQSDDMDYDPYGPGEYATARVDLDTSGQVIDVTGLDSSGADFNLRKNLEKRVRHMRFTPAVAYCKPVPSTYLLREGIRP